MTHALLAYVLIPLLFTYTATSSVPDPLPTTAEECVPNHPGHFAVRPSDIGASLEFTLRETAETYMRRCRTYFHQP